MAGILVYLPGLETADASELTSRGLGDLLDPLVDLIPTLVRSGPDGGPGCLVTFYGGGMPDAPRGFDAELQEWREAPPNGELERGRYWLGYVKAARPTPDDLVRREVCDGELVMLKDGRQWVVPIADYLPKRLTIDLKTGAEVRAVAERHREFCHWADSLFERFMSDGFSAQLEKNPVIEIPQGLTFTAIALAKNYRVNRDVIDLLQLIEEYEAFEVASVSCGLSGLVRALAQKKNRVP